MEINTPPAPQPPAKTSGSRSLNGLTGGPAPLLPSESIDDDGSGNGVGGNPTPVPPSESVDDDGSDNEVGGSPVPVPPGVIIPVPDAVPVGFPPPVVESTEEPEPQPHDQCGCQSSW
jgi:hypothetical protein